MRVPLPAARQMNSVAAMLRHGLAVRSQRALQLHTHGLPHLRRAEHLDRVAPAEQPRHKLERLTAVVQRAENVHQSVTVRQPIAQLDVPVPALGHAPSNSLGHAQVYLHFLAHHDAERAVQLRGGVEVGRDLVRLVQQPHVGHARQLEDQDALTLRAVEGHDVRLEVAAVDLVEVDLQVTSAGVAGVGRQVAAAQHAPLEPRLGNLVQNPVLGSGGEPVDAPEEAGAGGLRHLLCQLLEGGAVVPLPHAGVQQQACGAVYGQGLDLVESRRAVGDVPAVVIVLEELLTHLLAQGLQVPLDGSAAGAVAACQLHHQAGSALQFFRQQVEALRLTYGTAHSKRVTHRRRSSLCATLMPELSTARNHASAVANDRAGASGAGTRLFGPEAPSPKDHQMPTSPLSTLLRSASLLLCLLALVSTASVRAQAAPPPERLFETLEQAVAEMPKDSFDMEAALARIGATDPAAIFEWVRDNTGFVAYRGALKGASGVLMDRQGNSLDRALLLERLLETAGHRTALARAT